MDGRPVIHNYGHGGAGFTLCWGCAEETVALAEEILGRLNILTKIGWGKSEPLEIIRTMLLFEGRA